MVTEVPKPLMTIEVEVAFPVSTIDPAFEGILITAALVFIAVQTPATHKKSSDGWVRIGHATGVLAVVGGDTGMSVGVGVGGHTVVMQVG